MVLALIINNITSLQQSINPRWSGFAITYKLQVSWSLDAVGKQLDGSAAIGRSRLRPVWPRQQLPCCGGRGARSCVCVAGDERVQHDQEFKIDSRTCVCSWARKGTSTPYFYVLG